MPRKELDISGLTILGQPVREPIKRLETFPNSNPERPCVVEMVTEEFTCLCPVTGQPDYAKISIIYAPKGAILESKSLKLYLWAYREEGIFHEHVVNRILDDVVEALEPRWCIVRGDFNTRGGIKISVEVCYGSLGSDDFNWYLRRTAIDR